MTQVKCEKCGTSNNTSDMGYCWKCQSSLAAPDSSAFPSAADLRTAAKVIRWICNQCDKRQDEMPFLEKLWWKLTRENNDELRRKSALIEGMADKKPWDVEAWRTMLKWIRMTRQAPLWAAVPDVVTNREATLANWPVYAPEIKRLGWPTAFCVQDGMTPDDVPEDADVIFVGGSDRWKFPNLKMWTTHFPRVHCARVNAPEMFEACERLGCESIDGTGWFRDPSRPDKVPALERFIEGHRNKTPELAEAFAG